MQISQLPGQQALTEHADRIGDRHMCEYFTADTDRFRERRVHR